MTTGKSLLEISEHGDNEKDAAHPDDGCYVIPSLVMPGLYNPVRDSLGRPLMFLQVIERDEALAMPVQVQEAVRRYAKCNQDRDVARLTKDQKIDEARAQAREFGEEFLPAIYRAIAFWLGQREAKKMFSEAATVRRGRVRDPVNFEKDRNVIWAFEKSIAGGGNYNEAINNSIDEFVKQYPECRYREPSSIRRRVKRIIDKRLRSRERNEEINKRLKTLCMPEK